MPPVVRLSDEDLHTQVTAWLRSNLPDAWVRAIDEDARDELALARKALDIDDWWERLGESGWFFSNWPVKYGGRGLDSHQAGVVNDVLRFYKVPRSDNPLGLNVSRALLRWGTEEQRQRFLPTILKQKEIWVQLSVNPGQALTLQDSRLVPCVTAMSGLSTGKRCGRVMHTVLSGDFCWPGRTRMCPSTRGCRSSSSICKHRASRSVL